MNEKIGKIKLELLKEEFIKQIKDSYTLNLSMVLLEEFENLQQENKQLKKIKGKNQRTEDVLRQILKYCNYLHNDCKYKLNDGHIRKIRKIIRDYFGEEDKE